jgi:hypothetical protein
MGTATASSTFTLTVPAPVRHKLGWDEPGEVFFFVSPAHGSAVLLLGPPAPELMKLLSENRPPRAHPPKSRRPSAVPKKGTGA